LRQAAAAAGLLFDASGLTLQLAAEVNEFLVEVKAA
jgi:hypothetical protein